jgi:hypothetical protein
MIVKLSLARFYFYNSHESALSENKQEKKEAPMSILVFVFIPSVEFCGLPSGRYSLIFVALTLTGQDKS